MNALGGRTAAGTPRRADIQGLRALAVLLVVAFHAGLPVPGGFMGVDRCETSRNGTILYRDADHLSVAGALTLSDRFYGAIEALAR